MLEIRPTHLKPAREFVGKYHRHNIPPVGGKFAISCFESERLCGVAICGRPTARKLDDGATLEIYRNCTDGTRNALCITRRKRTGFRKAGIAAARYSAIRLTDARSASGFKRLSRKRGGGIRLFYLSQRGQTQHIFTITFTGKRKSASCAGGYGSRTTTGTPPIPRPSLQW